MNWRSGSTGQGTQPLISGSVVGENHAAVCDGQQRPTHNTSKAWVRVGKELTATPFSRNHTLDNTVLGVSESVMISDEMVKHLIILY